MRLLGWIVLAPLALMAVAFAVANRAPVVVSLDPLPLRLDLPLYLVVFLALAVGLILGGILVRISLWRRAASRRPPAAPAGPPPAATASPTSAILPPPTV
jgi:uncharacterized integral membrane protein